MPKIEVSEQDARRLKRLVPHHLRQGKLTTHVKWVIDNCKAASEIVNGKKRRAT